MKRTRSGSVTYRRMPKLVLSRPMPMLFPRSQNLSKRYESHVREIKYVDIAATSITARLYSTPPTATVLNIPVQGAAPYNRIGSKVMNKSLRICGYLTVNATTVQDFVRILVVYDRQTNGSAPSWTSVIQATTSAGAQSNYTIDGLNMDNRERFKVLLDDKVYTPSVSVAAGVLTNFAAPDTSGPTNRFNYDRWIALRGLETHYKATAGAVGDIATGGIFIFVVCTAQDNNWSFVFTSRLRYDDL
nr:MAG: capsid protein [Cressdnaviricota sp.]